MPKLNSISLEDESITKSVVSIQDRHNFLPSINKSSFLIIEGLLYHYADKYIQGYSGGYWEMITLSNGGKFMFLSNSEEVLLTNPMNYFSKKVSSETAGLALCALVYAHISETNYIKGKFSISKQMHKNFSLLRDYALGLKDIDRDAFLSFLA